MVARGISIASMVIVMDAGWLELFFVVEEVFRFRVVGFYFF